MNYAIGDTVVHWTHGIGTVVAIDQKYLAGITQQYYVVEIDPIELWVPVEDGNGGSIRFPADKPHFMQLFDILRGPGESLPDNPYQRKNTLRERMQKRTLEGLCHVIRDLTDRSRQHHLNVDDSFTLSRAEKYLLEEWVLSLGTRPSDALGELNDLLTVDTSGRTDQ